jgi:hypothetical protein
MLYLYYNSINMIADVGQGKYYIYRHIRLDKGEPFYIGLGKKRKKYCDTEESEYERAYVKEGRNILWQRIVDKTDYIVEILVESNDMEFIKEKEKSLFPYMVRNLKIEEYWLIFLLEVMDV